MMTEENTNNADIVTMPHARVKMNMTKKLLTEFVDNYVINSTRRQSWAFAVASAFSLNNFCAKKNDKRSTT